MDFQTKFALGTLLILFMIMLPILALIPLARKYPKQAPGKVMLTWLACIVVYYSIFFNVVPKYITRPWFEAQPHHEVQVCKTVIIYENQ